MQEESQSHVKQKDDNSKVWVNKKDNSTIIKEVKTTLNPTTSLINQTNTPCLIM